MTHAVFVSSTFVDLAEHRATVQGAIRQLGVADISMENFGARDERPKAECLRIIEQDTDTFVGIYAHRYGFVPKGEKKSITEAEYDAAGQYGIPRLVYVVNEDALWSPKFIDTGTNAKRLAQFKARLAATHVCKRFASKDDLAASVAADLGRHLLRSALVRIDVSPVGTTATAVRKDKWSPADWNKYRYGRYESNRDIFLVHTIAPSPDPAQLFDIFIYLQRHKSQDQSEISHVEFFLGPHWGNQIFHVPNDGGPIGIAVSAFGEFLCVCRISFNDGAEIFVDRYINFAEYARDSPRRSG